MPNQLNYGSVVLDNLLQRPKRVDDVTLALIETATKDVLFGTDARDHVEIWLYNLDGTIAASTIVALNDPALSITTLVDVSGPTELLNIDMYSILRTVDIEPGRYTMAMYFFRTEVGSESTYKLFIQDISQDRTEVKLSLVATTPEALTDIAAFVIPSVPKLYAQALVDELFGKVLNVPSGAVLANGSVSRYVPDQAAQIAHIKYDQAFYRIVDGILHRAYPRAIAAMIADTRSTRFTQDVLNHHVIDAVVAEVNEANGRGEFEPTLQLI